MDDNLSDSVVENLTKIITKIALEDPAVKACMTVVEASGYKLKSIEIIVDLIRKNGLEPSPITEPNRLLTEPNVFGPNDRRFLRSLRISPEPLGEANK